MSAQPTRSNGLPATVWTPMADLHPQVADIMLAILRDEGVAAYVAPATGSPGSFLQVRVPNQPTDRLFVDASAAGRAREVLLEHLPRLRAALREHPAAQGPLATPGAGPEPGAPGVDESVTVDEQAWADIVAAFEAPSADPVPRWPASEDVDDTEGGGPRPDGELGWPDEVEIWPTGAPDAGRASRAGPRPGHANAHEAGEHFEPPEPPPVPVGSPVSRLAWAGVLGGPAFIVLAALAGWHLAGVWALAPLVAFVAGFVTLVVRMRERPDDRDDPDDGAVV